MRLRLVAAFCAGFACGLVFLAVFLGLSGRLPYVGIAARPSPPPSVTDARPEAARMPEAARTEAARQPESSPVPPPAAQPEPPLIEPKPAPMEAPEAAREKLPEAPPYGVLTRGKLIIPVRGVHAEALRDDFAEMRGAHRHEAIDIMAPRGTPVLAADEGNVVKLFLSKPGGLTVYQFDNSRTYCYYYAHLDRYAPALKEGMFLRKGDVLGYVGSSGDASPSAPHLHFAIFRLGPERHWWQGTAVDPYGFLKGSE